MCLYRSESLTHCGLEDLLVLFLQGSGGGVGGLTVLIQLQFNKAVISCSGNPNILTISQRFLR